LNDMTDKVPIEIQLKTRGHLNKSRICGGEVTEH